MSKRRKVDKAIVAAIVTAIAAIVVALIEILPDLFNGIPAPPTPTSTPACINADDILVTFHILKNDEVIAELAPGETILLAPDTRVYFDPEIQSASNSTLPNLECKWTNTNIATDGKLLHTAGCNRVDYKSGHTDIEDAVVMQLSQPACPALTSSYPLFIMPEPE